MVISKILKPYGLPEDIQKEILDNWEKIRDDYLTLTHEDKVKYMSHYIKEHGKSFWEEGGMWMTFPLRNYPWGEKINEEKCEFTHQLLSKIPRLRAASFSILAPHSKTIKHRGEKDGTLRYHLGLIVPKGAYLSSESKKYKHKEGKMFKFDDTELHYAHNPTNKDRVVFLFDIEEKFSLLLLIGSIIIKIKSFFK